MPAVDQPPSSNPPPYQDAVDHWAVPLGTISGLKLYLSYGVFVAAAVLVGVLWIVNRAPHPIASPTADLPVIVLVGIAFWMVGWLVQLTVYGFFRFLFGVPIESVTIGILGVESRRRDWDARTALTVTSTSLIAVASVGALIVVAEQFVNGTNPWPQMFSVWSAPSFGLGSADSIWLGGAWLCWIQVICQAYPLPKSTGRVAIVAAVSLLTQRLGESFQTHFSRRSLQLVAFITALIALATVARSPIGNPGNWVFVFLLALLLWISARGQDVRTLVLSFGPFPLWENEESVRELTFQRVRPRRVSLVKRIKESVASIGQRRQLRQAIRSEHQEAIDAARLDDVLEQLHQHGRESLSPEDLAMLERISKNLQKERQGDGSNPL
jgi:hypothetical protein